MFRRLHIQMTIFSTLITSAILIIMTLACLFIAERGTRENSFTSFTNNARSCISHLESQSLLSHQWLLQSQAAYDVKIRINDNGNTLFYQELNPPEEDDSLFQKAADVSRDNYGLDMDMHSAALTHTEIFRMPGYYACTALIPKGSRALSAVILYPLDTLNGQLIRQRLHFALAVLAAITALAVFSWFFTEKMLRPLRESRRRQTDFIASASHELRSPLAVILSSLQAMEQASPDERKHFSHTIQKEGHRMSRLIDDMLSLANADNQSWKILSAPCELDTLLLDTYEKYQPLMLKKSLRLSIRLPEEPLSPCFCDASRISQVLGILLDNAMSYVPEGGRVVLSLAQDKRRFCLRISDNGPGISDDAKEAVFQRFYRADSARSSSQHFGLGLCIAHEIIALHKGTLTVTDTPGGGATFLITLPLQSSRP